MRDFMAGQIINLAARTLALTVEHFPSRIADEPWSDS